MFTLKGKHTAPTVTPRTRYLENLAWWDLAWWDGASARLGISKGRHAA